MGVLFIRKLSSHSVLGVWKIEETEQQITHVYPHLSAVVEPYRNTPRRVEKLSVYALLYAMQPDPAILITHNQDGKPQLEGYSISVSDTRGFVAVVLSERGRVGVDIEYYSTRVNKIAHRFIRSDEQSSTTEHQLLNWSAKETVYKYFSEQKLGYGDMRLKPFTPSEEGKLLVENMKTGQTTSVCFCLNRDFVLTYCCEDAIQAGCRD